MKNYKQFYWVDRVSKQNEKLGKMLAEVIPTKQRLLAAKKNTKKNFPALIPLLDGSGVFCEDVEIERELINKLYPDIVILAKKWKFCTELFTLGRLNPDLNIKMNCNWYTLVTQYEFVPDTSLWFDIVCAHCDVYVEKYEELISNVGNNGLDWNAVNELSCVKRYSKTFGLTKDDKGYYPQEGVIGEYEKWEFPCTKLEHAVGRSYQSWAGWIREMVLCYHLFKFIPGLKIFKRFKRDSTRNEDFLGVLDKVSKTFSLSPDKAAYGKKHAAKGNVDFPLVANTKFEGSDVWVVNSDFIKDMIAPVFLLRK